MASGEASLIRTCAPLYASFALESLSSFMLSILFMYLAFIILCKHRLRSPGLAVLRFLKDMTSETVSDFWTTGATWSTMQSLPLEMRFAFCRKMNIWVCVFSAIVSMISITRWLHVGNVNGFRYLGYAVTCPIMQAELVVLVAPIVPCYKATVVAAAGVTFLTMVSGYAGSLYAGDLWTGSFGVFMQTWHLADLKPEAKLWAVSPSFLGLAFLSFVQLPYLASLYTFHKFIHRKESADKDAASKSKVGDLPDQYKRLVTLVAVTWLAFPLWWMLSSEGMSIISDTKMNGFAFTFLNIVSKGSFTFQMLRMVRRHKQRLGRCNSFEEAAAAVDEPWYVLLLKPFDNNVMVSTNSDTPMFAPRLSFQVGGAPNAPRRMSFSVEGGANFARVSFQSDKSALIADVAREDTGAWDCLPLDYKLFLEAAGIREREFGKIDPPSKLQMKIRYLDTQKVGLREQFQPASEDDDSCQCSTSSSECEWHSLQQAYRLYLEAAGIQQREFENLDAPSKLQMKIGYMEVNTKLLSHPCPKPCGKLQSHDGVSEDPWFSVQSDTWKPHPAPVACDKLQMHSEDAVHQSINSPEWTCGTLTTIQSTILEI